MSEVYAGLRYRDADAALDWITGVLGLRELFVVRGDGGRIAHAEVGWGGGAVMLGERSDAPGGGQVYLVADDATMRAAYQRVTAAGAEVRRPLADQGYGWSFTAADPEGNEWSVGTYRPAVPAPPGAPGWLEIGSPDPGPTRDFFAALFGWAVEPMPGGNANFTGPGVRAGLHGDDPARNVVVYFAVPDVDAAVARVRELGGTIDDAGPDTQGFGRFTTGTDPSGVAFGLHQAPTSGG